jgi:hypothetical protein
MTLPTIEEARSWRGLMLVAAGNEPVGRIDAIYVDRTTKRPEWALVHTGLFGSARTFVPVADAVKLGDTVQVPHDLGVIREAPRLESDADLSEDEELRLYAHYGIDYSMKDSPSGLPATDATAELRPTAAGPSQAAPRLEADAAAWPERETGGGRRPLLAGIGALGLAAVGAGLAALRTRRRRPPSFGDRMAKVGRDAADTLAGTTESLVRQAAAVGRSDNARRAAASGQEAARRAAALAAAGGAAAAAGARQAARRAGGASLQASEQAASSGRRFARRATTQGREAAAAAAGAKATVTAKRRARRRARKREQAAAAAAGAARSLTAFPTAGGRRMQRLDLDGRGRKASAQARKAVPRRRRRSKMKVRGKLGMAVGAAVGYVLGAKAGRERYEQIVASARQFMDRPQVKRVMENAPGNLGARVEQVANKAADAVHQASDRVAPSGTGTGATAEPAPVSSATGRGGDDTGPQRGAGSTSRRTGGSGSSSQEQAKDA